MIRLRSSKKIPKLALDDIFSEEDDLGLLDVAPLKVKAPAGNLSASQYEEITVFYEKHGRAPEGDADSFDEKKLARRLKAFKSNPEQCEALKDFDPYGLLLNGLPTHFSQSLDTATQVVFEPTPSFGLDKSELVTSLDDIFDDDDGLLEFDAPDIFTMRHVPTEKKSQPDEIAKRQPCADFPRYVSVFEAAQKELKTGSATLERFRHELQIHIGDFFILGGVMGYVHSAGERLEG